MTKKKPHEPVPPCSFCGKSFGIKKQIKIMFFSRGAGTAICRECVTEFFWGIIGHDQREAEKKQTRDLAAVALARRANGTSRTRSV